jgi:hypothetical protein
MPGPTWDHDLRDAEKISDSFAPQTGMTGFSAVIQLQASAEIAP